MTRPQSQKGGCGLVFGWIVPILYTFLIFFKLGIAKWEKIEVYHDLNLDLDGGTLDEVPTQYLEGEEFILPIPTKEGYTFLGWYNGSEKVEKISATETAIFL